jgi:hypothetical protein
MPNQSAVATDAPMKEAEDHPGSQVARSSLGSRSLDVRDRPLHRLPGPAVAFGFG